MSSLPFQIDGIENLEKASPEQHQLAHDILEILLEYRRIPKSELENLKGKYGTAESDEVDTAVLYPHQYAPILHSVLNNQKVNMCVLGFPCKSSNFLKVTSELPDTGERLVMHMFNHLCACIEEIHSPGANFTICSDGHAFQPYLRVTDESVTAFNTRLREIAVEDKLDNIKFFDLTDVYGADKTATELRTLFDTEFGPSWADIEVLKDIDPEISRTLRDGFEVFMREEVRGFAMDGRLSAEEKTTYGMEKCAKDLALGVMKMSRGWGRAVASKLHNYVRTSVHPQVVGAPKFGIKTLGALRNSIWSTPWHCIPLFRNKEVEEWTMGNMAEACKQSALELCNDIILIRFDEAVQMGATPVYNDKGQIIHFIAVNNIMTLD